MNHKSFFTACIISLGILASFFLGYQYAQREYIIQNNSQENIYVDVTVSSRGIRIKNIPENVFLRVDGVLMQSGSINLE